MRTLPIGAEQFIHAQVLRTGLFRPEFTGNRLIEGFQKCPDPLQAGQPTTGRLPARELFRCGGGGLPGSSGGQRVFRGVDGLGGLWATRLLA